MDIQSLTYDEINKVFESDILNEQLLNLLSGAFIVYEEMRNTYKASALTYDFKPFFIGIFLATIFLICKVSIYNSYIIF